MELLGHDALDHVALILAQQAVVDEDARQLVADRALQQRRRDGAVHAAGERQQHLAAADSAAAVLHGLLQIRRHRPLRGEAADLIQKVFQDVGAVDRVQHLGVELHAIELLLLALHRRVGAARGGADDLEPGAERADLHAVAHPIDCLFGHAVEERGVAAMGQLDLAVFARLGAAALAAQQVDHQLQPVADAEHRHTQLENRGIDHRRALFKHGGGAAGEDQRVRREGADLVHRHAVGLNLAVDAAFTDAAGDQQVILPAEVQNQNFFHLRYPPGSECGARWPRR